MKMEHVSVDSPPAINSEGTWPQETREIAVRPHTDLATLRLEHIEPRRPVLFKNVVPRAVLAQMAPRNLRQEYGDVVVSAKINWTPNSMASPRDDFVAKHVRRTTFAKFLDYIDSETRNLPCYAQQVPISRFPGLAEKVSMGPVPSNLRPKFLWCGSENASSSLHFDSSDSNLLQLYGKKSVALIDFDDSRYIYPYHDAIRYSRVDPLTFSLKDFPRMASVRPMVATLEPGDLLFIPRWTWHFAWGQTPSISASRFKNKEWTYRWMGRILWRYGARYTVRTIAQMVRHGMFNRPYIRKAYMSYPPTGLILWRMIRGVDRKDLFKHAVPRPKTFQPGQKSTQ